MPIEPPAKSPIASKILLSAGAVIAANAAVAPAALGNAEQLQAVLGTVIPVQYIPIFNILAAAAIAAFRVWSSGSQVKLGGEKRLGK